ncbi:Protein fam49a [Lobulomyces angularis]|nr:Protein fam49a [Lobulomyces angularis]
MNVQAIIRSGSSQSLEEPPYQLEVDLDAASPTPEETNFYNYISDVIRPCQANLESLRTYPGCGDYIRKAISSPSRESENEAWEVVLPAVAKLRQFYEMALKLDEAFVKAIQFFAQGSVLENLEKYQATAKKLSEILYICAQFDEIKISNPNIQNDFSYYRRTLSKMRMVNPSPQNLVVNDELANRMSLFYAHSTPLTKSLIDSAQGLGSKGVPNGEICDLFAILAAVCYFTVQKNPQAPADYFLRTMVMSIILYDHVNPQGAFIKTSTINMKASVKVIQTRGGSISDSLLGSLKYTTIHLNDETTPKQTKALFA